MNEKKKIFGIPDKKKFLEDIKKDLNITDHKEFNTNIDFSDIEYIFKNSFTSEEIIDNPNNIYRICKISDNEAKLGSNKIIQYTRINFYETNKKSREEKREVELKIPKGIKDGQQILLRGEGNRSQEYKEVGNLIVTIQIK